MKTNSVRASGTTLAPLGPMVSLTCFWMAPTASSHSSWNFPGTPLVALARKIMPKVMTMAPAIMVAQMMSTSKVRPPSLT